MFQPALSLFGAPVVSAVLLTLAFLALMAEVRSPGFGRSGVAGALALLLFFLPHWLEGGWVWSGVVAMVGLAILWPALRDPSRRWAARVGLAVTAGAVYAAILRPDVDHLDHAHAAAVLVTAAALVILVRTLMWMRLPASQRPESGDAVFFHVPGLRRTEPRLGAARLVGRRGQAVTTLEPDGVALFAGRRVRVSTEGEWAEEGQHVEVTHAEGIHVFVRPVAGPEGEATSLPGPSS